MINIVLVKFKNMDEVFSTDTLSQTSAGAIVEDFYNCLKDGAQYFALKDTDSGNFRFIAEIDSIEYMIASVREEE